MAYCNETGVWCLTYIDRKGMFCKLRRLTDTMHPTNACKIWKCEPNIPYRAEMVKYHFKKNTNKQTRHKDAVTTELAKYGSYLTEK